MLLLLRVAEAAGMDVTTLLSAHWADLGATGLLGAVVWMVLTGRLVSGKELKNARTERDAWQRVALRAMGQSDQLLVGSEVTSSVMKALKDQVTGKPPSEGAS